MSDLPSPRPPAKPPATRALFAVHDLAVSFQAAGGQRIRAVDGLSLTLRPRQTLALVGESGCGKSVTALTALQLIPQPPAHIDRGSVIYNGRNLLALPEREMLKIRGREIAMIFQEPTTSLNPVYSVGDQIIEAVRLHQKASRSESMDIAIQAMHDVGIPDPQRQRHAYPHQFSGGMQQRIMTAMALACRPKVLLADEPTTALDVTIQAQILDLLHDLQRKTGMGMMLISHDLGVVAQNSDVVCVMHDGHAIEYADVYELFDRPLHPYTRALFKSIPPLRRRRHRLATVAELLTDPAEFRKLPGYQYGVVPWWPAAPPPRSVEHTGPRSRVMYEVEPDHWVACWRTEYLAGHPIRRPDLEFRKDAASEASVQATDQ
ncbi:MAG: ABC transporter ATP-binding protein [Phycisphaerales bacterium]|nr:MAG: ABC transporter ATP-binding protein [Phycisphaerales bacterium]